MNIKILILFGGAAFILLGVGIWMLVSNKEDEVKDGDERKEKRESIISKYNYEDNSLIHDYEVYKLNMGERLKYGLLGGTIFFITIFAFYRIMIVALIGGIAAGLVYPELQKNKLVEKRKKELTSQFKEAITYISDSLEVGNSFENGIRETVTELKNNFGNSAYITREFIYIVKMLDNGQDTDVAFRELSQRTKIEDIKNFSDVCATCKKTSGDVRSVIRRTASIIRDKDETIKEVELMISDKKFEQMILNIVPLGLILMLSSTAWDFMEPVYTTGKGRITMTIALILYLISICISKKIMDIEV